MKKKCLCLGEIIKKDGKIRKVYIADVGERRYRKEVVEVANRV